MKNTGVSLTILLAVIMVLIGGYFLLQRGVKPGTFKPTQQLTPGPSTSQGKPFTTNVPTKGAGEVVVTGDIDTELEKLDSEINSAFQKDSDSDPTTGI